MEPVAASPRCLFLQVLRFFMFLSNGTAAAAVSCSNHEKKHTVLISFDNHVLANLHKTKTCQLHQHGEHYK